MHQGWGGMTAGALLLLAMPATQLSAQAAESPAQPAAVPPGGYAMPSTEVWEIAAASGETYRIFVSIPQTPPPENGYPVLYVLDGNANFASFAETRRVQESSDHNVGNSLVVGVGYPTEQPYDARRLYDFTQAVPAEVPHYQRSPVPYRTGGRAGFLDFLTGRLRPELARRYRIDPERQALFGHSLGGLFALYALYNRPGAFNAIIAASPSQWWNDQSILAEERAFVERLSQGKLGASVSRIMVVAGEEEDKIVNSWDAEALAKRLAPLSIFGLRSRFDLYANEGHMTVPNAAVTDALRFAFEWP